jgi:hypothetical protein
MPSLLPVRGLSTTSDRFRQQLYDGARARGLNPDYLASVISFESEFNPRAENPSSHALGLLQWLNEKAWAATAARAGHPGLSRQALRSMSAEEQLPFVFAWYEGQKIGDPSSLGDYYLAVWSPAYIGRLPSTVVARKGELTYTQNAKAFDPTGKGYFTVADVTRPVENRYREALGLPPIDASAPALGVSNPRAMWVGVGVAVLAYLSLPRVPVARRVLALGR